MKKKYIQDRIAMLVFRSNVSEREVSRHLGRSPGYIQSITSGKILPSLDMLLAICDYFHLTPAEFFEESIPNPCQLHLFKEYCQTLSEQQTDLMLQIMETLVSGIR